MAYQHTSHLRHSRGLTHCRPLPSREGTGKNMRHVKVKPGLALDRASLEALISAAYRDIVARLRTAA